MRLALEDEGYTVVESGQRRGGGSSSSAAGRARRRAHRSHAAGPSTASRFCRSIRRSSGRADRDGHRPVPTPTTWVAGLEGPAPTNYVTKPFVPKEAGGSHPGRCSGRARSSDSSPSSMVCSAMLEIRPEAGEVLVAGKPHLPHQGPSSRFALRAGREPGEGPSPGKQLLGAGLGVRLLRGRAPRRRPRAPACAPRSRPTRAHPRYVVTSRGLGLQAGRR